MFSASSIGFETWRIETKAGELLAGFLLADGPTLVLKDTQGKRHALPHARILMHQPSAGVGGTAADIAIQADMLTKTKHEMAELIAQHTGQPVERIVADSDRDRWFTAQEALEYGFVDKVITRANQATTN